MLNLEYGLLFFLIGMTVTIGGFFIAFLIASHYQKPKVNDTEENALTEYRREFMNK